jgi:glycosyltransferase involved in cell wall biosynthesis
MPPAFDCIVVGCHLRYDGVWQRPQQILSRLARHVPVTIVEEPFLAAHEGEHRENYGHLRVVRPLRTSFDAPPVDERTIESVRAWVGERRPLVWLYSPMMLALADAFPGAPLVYDCMDELAAFAFAPAEMKQRETDLLDRACLVFAGGRSLYEARAYLGPKVKLYPSGVEFDHFARAASMRPHALFGHLPRPVYGYFGVIDERLDLDVLDALAATDAQTVMIGPVAKIDPKVLPRRSNVHFTGAVDYATLPSFLAGFDVALLPFARNAATANISPTKTPEYLAGGKPVVSTHIADVVTDWGDVVTIAESPEAFAAECAQAAATPDLKRSAQAKERARHASWDAIVNRMWHDLKTA